MVYLAQIAIRILTKPRETAKYLIEGNKVNVALWFYLISICVSSSIVISWGDVSIQNNTYKVPFYLGIFILGDFLALIGLSFLLNVFSIIFNGRRNFKETLLSVVWSSGPGLFIEVALGILLVLMDIALDLEFLILDKESLDLLLSISLGVGLLVIIIKYPIQIIFLSEVYKLSIFRVVLIHVATLAFSYVVWVFLLIPIFK